MATYKSILHPTDFSEAARPALTLAARMAQAQGATLHLLHAVLLHQEDRSKEERQMQQAVEAARQEGARVEPLVVRAVSAYEAIAQRVDEVGADLIVMGTHGRSGLGRFLMGSVAEKVLRHAPCDVLTVRPDARAASAEQVLARVLVPVDFSEHARRALARARSLAAPGALVLLHVVQPLPPMFLAGGIESKQQLDPKLPARVEQRLREWAGDPPPAARMAEGQPAREIVRAAGELEAGLIVMGTRGLSGVEHALVGSVTERVCRSAKVPVLVTR